MAEIPLSECGFHGRWACFRNFLWLEKYAEWGGANLPARLLSAGMMAYRLHPVGRRADA